MVVIRISTILLLLAIIGVSHVKSFLLVHGNVHRNVTKILQVSNGGQYGTWEPKEFCAEGTYAIGYTLKIESWQHSSDDTALNGIRLECASKEGGFGGTIHSGEGAWGSWIQEDVKTCDSRDGVPHFLTGFALAVEEYQSSGDDTEANFVKFHCRDFDGQAPEYELAISPGHGKWGSYGSFSASCDYNTAICGLSTRIEQPQGGGDDTALNDVVMYCCP